jgi:hypothetical protein
LDLFAIILTDYLGAGTDVSTDSRSGSSAGIKTATGSSARNVTVTQGSSQAASKQIPASGGKRVADQVIVQNFRAPLSTMRCLRTAVLSFDVFSLCSVQEPPFSEAGSGSPFSEAGSNASTVMRHRNDQIDLTSDFQAAIDINGQFNGQFLVDIGWFRPNPLHSNSELQQFPETSIPRMNPAAGMQNLAVLFRVHKFLSFDPFLGER